MLEIPSLYLLHAALAFVTYAQRQLARLTRALQPQAAQDDSGQHRSLLRTEALSQDMDQGESDQSNHDEPSRDRLVPDLELDRHLPALHSADFSFQRHLQPDTRSASGPIPVPVPSISPSLPKFSFEQFYRPADGHLPQQEDSSEFARSVHVPPRHRVISLQGPSSSFVLKEPTSPLVQQENNDDSDFDTADLGGSPKQTNRRCTLPPGAFSSLTSSSPGGYRVLAQQARRPLSLQRENTFPRQGQSDRRSLNATWPDGLTSPTTPPFLRSRIPSFSSDASPRRASLVGSYEESLLRGGMSGNVSQPLIFQAHIGVVGSGECKPSCPPHVKIDFPAVYYSWSTGQGRVSSANDEPSPYTGQIDLENSLPPPRPRQKCEAGEVANADKASGNQPSELKPKSCLKGILKDKSAKRRSSRSPLMATIGGAYRIPECGKLQIMIRNPNKRAVRIFTVPYSLTGMEKGQKTWVRQRICSKGPIVDDEMGFMEGAQARSSLVNDPQRKPVLRYLVHAKICCPSKGYYCLYSEIKVIFANRTPDDKENLDIETTYPEPKYSTFKPTRSRGQSLDEGAMTGHPDDRIARRRSHAFGLSELMSRSEGSSSGLLLSPFDDAQASDPVPAIPATFLQRRPGRPNRHENGSESYDLDSQDSISTETCPLDERRTNRPFSSMSPSSLLSDSSNDSSNFSKLSRGDNGCGGHYGRPMTPEPGEGLIARRLRGLHVDGDRGKEDSQEL